MVWDDGFRIRASRLRLPTSQWDLGSRPSVSWRLWQALHDLDTSKDGFVSFAEFKAQPKMGKARNIGQAANAYVLGDLC